MSGRPQISCNRGLDLRQFRKMTARSHPLSDSFQVLARFLGNFSDHTEAHAREELTSDQIRLIERLARCEASPEERDSLVPLLATNENALDLLARLAKTRIGGGDTTAS